MCSSCLFVKQYFIRCKKFDEDSAIVTICDDFVTSKSGHNENGCRKLQKSFFYWDFLWIFVNFLWLFLLFETVSYYIAKTVTLWWSQM
jgi:hypothetical protein